MATQRPLAIYKAFYRPGVPSTEQPDVARAAAALANFIATEPSAADSDHDTETVGARIYTAVCDVQAFGCSSPAGLDYALRVYAAAAAQLPSAAASAADSASPSSSSPPAASAAAHVVRNCYGTGAEAALGQLRMWLADWALFFQGDVDPDDVGRETTWDRAAAAAGVDTSNVVFSHAEVAQNLPGVLAKLRNFSHARREQTIALAMLARAHSLDIARLWRGGNCSNDENGDGNNDDDHDDGGDDGKNGSKSGGGAGGKIAPAGVGDHAAVLVDGALDPFRQTSPPWCMADFIATCVMLRGCAGSLLGMLPPPKQGKRLEKQEKKLREWREGFADFLHSEDWRKRSDATENVGGKRAAGTLDEGAAKEQHSVKNRNDDFVVKMHAGVCALVSFNRSFCFFLPFLLFSCISFLLDRLLNS
jgi:hypothetical protein